MSNSKMVQSLLCIAVLHLSNLVGMDPKLMPENVNERYLVCPWRVSYNRGKDDQNQTTSTYTNWITEKEQKTCPFCDPKILKKNKIMEKTKNLLLLFNLNPYINGYHLLVIPTRHVKTPNQLSEKEHDAISNKIIEIHNKFYTNSCDIDIGLNLGPGSGQSVKHLHWHMICNTTQPSSLAEAMKSITQEVDITKLFEKAKLILNEKPTIIPRGITKKYLCKLCTIIKTNTEEKDKDNLVVHRGKHNNLVMLSHHPKSPGQVEIVPYKHTNTLAFLSEVTSKELTELCNKLIVILSEEMSKMRDVNGMNIALKSDGCKSKDILRHISELVIPRTTITESFSCFVGSKYHPLDYKKLINGLRNRFENG